MWGDGKKAMTISGGGWVGKRIINYFSRFSRKSVKREKYEKISLWRTLHLAEDAEEKSEGYVSNCELLKIQEELSRFICMAHFPFEWSIKTPDWITQTRKTEGWMSESGKINLVESTTRILRCCEIWNSSTFVGIHIIQDCAYTNLSF